MSTARAKSVFEIFCEIALWVVLLLVLIGKGFSHQPQSASSAGEQAFPAAWAAIANQ